MKSFVQEYGQVIMLSVLTVLLIVFLWKGGLFEALKDANPSANTAHGDKEDYDSLKFLAGLDRPALRLKSRRLTVGEAYHYNIFVESASDCFGKDLMSRVCLVNGGEEDGRIIPMQKGIHTVMYYVEDDNGLYTKKGIQYVAE